MTILETDRLLVRTWMPGDAEAATRIYGDAQVMRFIPVGVMTRPQIVAMIARMSDEHERRGFGLWPVTCKTTGRLIGECGLHVLPETGEVEIGWLYERANWGRGYATEAARAVLAFAFDVVRLARVVALIDSRNLASISVAHRLAMRYERDGRYYDRDLGVYAKEIA